MRLSKAVLYRDASKRILNSLCSTPGGLFVPYARITHIVQQRRGARHNVSKASKNSLLPIEESLGGRPKVQHTGRKMIAAYRAYCLEVLHDDIKPRPRSDGPDQSNWWMDCKGRLSYTSGLGSGYGDRFWIMLNTGCAAAMGEGMDPKEEADARMVFAREKPPGYSPIYYNSHRQADALYILGRTHFERNSKFHKLAWFMLSVASEMGQLDAAILLHRLERVNKSLTAGVKARNFIARAALDSRDWRAIMAFVEMEILDQSDMKRSIQSMGQAVSLLQYLIFESRPESARITGGPDLEPILHPDALEEYVPPCRYFWKIIQSEHARLLPYLKSQGTSTDRFWADFAAAVFEDATEHQNPRAMYELCKLPQGFGYAESQPGSDKRRSMLSAASSTIPEACYILAKEMCTASDLIPTRKDMERSSESFTADKGSLNATQALAVQQVIKTAQMYHGKNATNEAYLYLFAGGLLHDNGTFDRGKQVLQLALPALRETIKITQSGDLSLVKLLEGLLARWDSYRSKGLYASVRPEDMIVKLDQIILEPKGDS